MGEWLKRASMPTPRHDLQAITVDKKIYAISGAGDETYDVVEIYDPAADSWSSGPPIPSRRGWFGAALLDGYIYAIAGKRLRPQEEKDRSGDIGHYQIRDTVERLELSTGTWTAVESLSEPRAGVVATVCAGRIYAIGGNAMNNETRSGGPHLDRVEVYDPETGHWSLAPIPTGRCDSGIVTVGRKMYTFGGWGGLPRHDRVEVYDVDSDTWTEETSMPEKKAWMSAAAISDRIFVLGGASQPPEGGKGNNIWLDSVHELV